MAHVDALIPYGIYSINRKYHIFSVMLLPCSSVASFALQAASSGTPLGDYTIQDVLILVRREGASNLTLKYRTTRYTYYTSDGKLVSECKCFLDQWAPFLQPMSIGLDEEKVIDLPSDYAAKDCQY
jgi:hypothetical protein